MTMATKVEPEKHKSFSSEIEARKQRHKGRWRVLLHEKKNDVILRTRKGLTAIMNPFWLKFHYFVPINVHKIKIKTDFGKITAY